MAVVAVFAVSVHILLLLLLLWAVAAAATFFSVLFCVLRLMFGGCN